MNNIIIKKLRLSRGPSSLISQTMFWVEDDIYVTNVTEEGLFIHRYKSELFTGPVHKIIIKYSNCL